MMCYRLLGGALLGVGMALGGCPSCFVACFVLVGVELAQASWSLNFGSLSPKEERQKDPVWRAARDVAFVRFE